MRSKDIKKYDFSAKVGYPAYFLCLDRKTESVVLSIRGTMSFRDVATDASAKRKQFLEGEAHEGMAHSTENLYKLLAPTILSLVQETKWKLVITGHSLGAGTASLFLMLFASRHPDVHSQGYAFAPPASVCPILSLKYQDRLTSFIYNYDIIPRLGLESVEDLKKDISLVSNNINIFSKKCLPFFFFPFSESIFNVFFFCFQRKRMLLSSVWNQEMSPHCPNI